MATVEMNAARPVSEVLAWGRVVLDPALRAAVEELPASMRRTAGYHLGWRDEHGARTGSGEGKAIRPTCLYQTDDARVEAVLADPAGTLAALEPAYRFFIIHRWWNRQEARR